MKTPAAQKAAEEGQDFDFVRMAQTANKYAAQMPQTTFVTSNTGSGVYYAPSTGTTTTYSASSLMGK